VTLHLGVREENNTAVIEPKHVKPHKYLVIYITIVYTGWSVTGKVI
jgi:hypothetical protein